MKTNKDVSLKLEEVGFEADSMLFIDLESEECQMWGTPPGEGFVKAYDLETILEALPEFIRIDDRGFRRRLEYQDLYYRDCGDYWIYRSCFIEGNTLATTAANLLTMLVEEGVINLNEDDENTINNTK